MRARLTQAGLVNAVIRVVIRAAVWQEGKTKPRHIMSNLRLPGETKSAAAGSIWKTRLPYIFNANVFFLINDVI
jgi:hypothetical protein